MARVSVIIPYFQREPGILARALRSIQAQEIPEGWQVETIVVDDGSPLPALGDVAGIEFEQPLQLRVVSQPNMGAAVARNRGLDEVARGTNLIAFLDSDDIWPTRHLANAIEAYGNGYELCFCDNVREDHHVSYIAECGPKTSSLLQARARHAHDGLVPLPADSLPGLIIEEFPTQISTVTYSQKLAPGLRFNTDLHAAGEDVLFLVTLAARARTACFNSATQVHCGDGINIFFKNFQWDSPSFMSIKHDQVRCHTLIGMIPTLSASTLAINQQRLSVLRNEFAFHTIRYLKANRFKFPRQLRDLARSDPHFAVWFPLCFSNVMLKYPLGMYRP